MRKKLQSITSKLSALAAIAALFIIWELVSYFEVVPSFMLPSPVAVIKAFFGDAGLLAEHAAITLQEAFLGLLIGVALGFLFAILMDQVKFIYKAFYPIVVLSQTIPTVAIAPLLVLWFGYEMTPKIILIVMATFFPITVGVLDGFKSADQDAINLLKSMGAGKIKIFLHIKCPYAMNSFFSGLRMSAAYSVVTAVISEWLGGFGGLGVYMTRVKKGFAFDKMFAVIFLISIISLLLMLIVNIVQRKCMPYKYLKDND